MAAHGDRWLGQRGRLADSAFRVTTKTRKRKGRALRFAETLCALDAGLSRHAHRHAPGDSKGFLSPRSAYPKKRYFAARGTGKSAAHAETALVETGRSDPRQDARCFHGALS